VYGALAPLTEGNFQFGLNYGSGLGVFSGQLVNTGIISASAGNGITVTVSETNPLSRLSFVPFTITNSTSTDTSAPFQQMVVVNPSLYTSYLASNLSNVQWYDSSGNVINSWLESGNSNTTTETVYWLKLPNGIGANSSITVYMGIASTTTNMLNNTTTGEAPQLSATYGEYDNGANVFNFYDNFAGTSLNTSKWTSYYSSYITVNNGITFGSGGLCFIETNSKYSISNIVEMYVESGIGSDSGIMYVVDVNGNQYTNADYGEWIAAGTSPGQAYNYTEADTRSNYSLSNGNAGSGANIGYPYPNTALIMGVNALSSQTNLYVNNNLVVDNTNEVPPQGNYYIALGGYESNLNVYYVRILAYPPNGTMPAISAGSLNTGSITISNTGIISASAGNGISVSGTNPLTITNTGVLSLQGDTGSLSLSAGTGIGISGLTISNTGIISASAGSGISVSGTNPLTITNTGVLSLQGDTGALSLTAGTGIGISGLTISNTGIISASAGSGISVSGTNPLTITNTGVLSLQGDTGALSLSAGTGIGISGLTISNTGIISASAGDGISVSGTNPLSIAMSGSYSGVFTASGALTTGNGAWNYDNNGMVFYPDIELWRDASSDFGLILLEGSKEGIFALGNRSSTTQTSNNFGGSGLASGYAVYPLIITTAGGVYTSGTTNNSKISTVNPNPRNVLDDGSGNMSISGSFTGSGNMTIGGSFTGSGNMTVAGSGTFNLINANKNNTAGSTKGGDEIIAIYGGLQSFPTGTTDTMYGLGTGSNTLEVYTDSNINFWQLGFSVDIPGFNIGGASSEAGTYSLIQSAHNILDDGSGNMTITGNLTRLQYYHSTTFTALYTTTNTGGVNGNGVDGVYNVLTNTMHVNIGASTISVFSVFGEHNNGGGTGVGVLITSVSYSAGTQIPYDSLDIIAYFPAISTAGNTGDNSSTQTWIASGVASTNGTYYISIASQETCCTQYLTFNQTVITFP